MARARRTTAGGGRLSDSAQEAGVRGVDLGRYTGKSGSLRRDWGRVQCAPGGLGPGCQAGGPEAGGERRGIAGVLFAGGARAFASVPAAICDSPLAWQRILQMVSAA